VGGRQILLMGVRVGVAVMGVRVGVAHSRSAAYKATKSKPEMPILYL